MKEKNIKLYRIAFTLIELLVVIAIIGILSGLIVVSMSGVTQKANIAKAQVFSNSLRNALMANIIAEWKFDGVTSERVADNNDVVDTWGGINNGDVLLPTVHQPTVKIGSSCVSGSCLSFNGSNYIDTTNFADNLSNFTIAFWLKTTNNGVIIGKISQTGSGKGWAVYGGGRYFLIQQSTSIYKYTISVSPIPYDDSWHYWVGIKDSSYNLNVYIDGKPATISLGSLGTITDFSNTNIVRIGQNGDLTSPYVGLIDDVRIYNTILPTAQIKEQYYVGLNKMLNSGNISREEYINRISNLIAKR
jgi:prepilin-type N-terminal cleavage/methylation domain-containing protein